METQEKTEEEALPPHLNFYDHPDGAEQLGATGATYPPYGHQRGHWLQGIQTLDRKRRELAELLGIENCEQLSPPV